MPVKLARLWAWLQTPEGTKVARYSMVSVISTAVSFVVLFLVYGVGRLWSEVPSTVFANGVATVPSYWLNRNWAWGKTGRSHLLKEVLPFWVIAAAGIAFSIFWADLAGHIGKHYAFSHEVRTVLVLAANVTSFGVFWVLKLLIFDRLFQVSPLIEEVGGGLQPEGRHREEVVQVMARAGEATDAAQRSVRKRERPQGAVIR